MCVGLERGFKTHEKEKLQPVTGRSLFGFKYLLEHFCGASRINTVNDKCIPQTTSKYGRTVREGGKIDLTCNLCSQTSLFACDCMLKLQRMNEGP